MLLGQAMTVGLHILYVGYTVKNSDPSQRRGPKKTPSGVSVDFYGCLKILPYPLY